MFGLIAETLHASFHCFAFAECSKCLDARMVKGVDLRSTGLQAAWVRSQLQTLIFNSGINKKYLRQWCFPFKHPEKKWSQEATSAKAWSTHVQVTPGVAHARAQQAWPSGRAIFFLFFSSFILCLCARKTKLLHPSAKFFFAWKLWCAIFFHCRSNFITFLCHRGYDKEMQ